MDAQSIKVLLIEDSPVQASLIQALLAQVEGTPFTCEWAHRLTTGLDRLAEGGIDLILLDLGLPESDGLNTFLRTQAQAPGLPIVVLTGLDDDELALKAMQGGAEDYLVKGQVDRNGLGRSLRYAIERTRRRRAEAVLAANRAEFRAARAIQEKLIPIAPDVPSFDIAGMSFCAESTCGDYFDYIRMVDGCVGIVIADVSGHNLASALLMASTRAYIRTLARTRADPGEVLTLANQALAEDIKEDHFATAVLVCLNQHTQSLVHASAGHPTGYLLDARGAVKAELKSTGPPLGIFPEAAVASSSMQGLAPGDLLLLLTDGVAEACSPDGASFGIQRALDIVRVYQSDSARQIIDNLYYAVVAFSQNAPPIDDITAVVLKVELAQ